MTRAQKARDIQALDRYIPKLEGRKDCQTARLLLLKERMRLSLELEKKK